MDNNRLQRTGPHSRPPAAEPHRSIDIMNIRLIIIITICAFTGLSIYLYPMFRGRKIPPDPIPEELAAKRMCHHNLRLLKTGRDDILELRSKNDSTAVVTIIDVIKHTKKYMLNKKSPIYDLFPHCESGGTYNFDTSCIPRCSYHGYSDY